jgi:hypothetical protein
MSGSNATDNEATGQLRMPKPVRGFQFQNHRTQKLKSHRLLPLCWWSSHVTAYATSHRQSAGTQVRAANVLARLGHVSQPRMSQILNLNLLAPDIQEELLYPSGHAAISEFVKSVRVRPTVF